ncbi:MAG: glycosyltransferase family 4 protein [Gemmatimonadota bacterium]|nr:glycosyltransferase family 4 protein [Gemmatimonadota bacterium]
MNKLKVFFLTEGTRTSAASRIRVFGYLDRLREDGRLEAKWASFTSEAYCRNLVAGRATGPLRRVAEKLFQAFSVLRLAFGCLTCDVVFIQRILLPVWVQRLAAFLNSSLVYDYDDAMYLGERGRGKRFASQLALASRVLLVSKAAAEEAAARRGAGPGKLVHLPSALEVAAYKSRPGSGDSQVFTVGWIGSPATTRYLEEIWEQLAAFAASCNEVRFLFIGVRPFEVGALSGSTRFEPWSAQAEKELLCRMDVGLMPLEDDPWCRGKGGYKLIQYMAAGIATLASPVGANLEIVLEGRTGMFVRKPGDWAGALESLRSDRGLCRSLGRAGKQRALELYDYTVTTPVFFKTLKDAIR